SQITAEPTASGAPEELDETDTATDGQAADLDRDAERRRRRRGRRGGRRNRRERESEGLPDAATATERQQEATGHFDVDSAVNVGPSSPQPESEQQPHLAAAPHVPAEPTSPRSPSSFAESTSSEPVRRRSTVREPAPVSLHHDTTGLLGPVSGHAPAEPVVSDTENEESGVDKPRRSGWWSKRLKGL